MDGREEGDLPKHSRPVSQELVHKGAGGPVFRRVRWALGPQLISLTTERQASSLINPVRAGTGGICVILFSLQPASRDPIVLALKPRLPSADSPRSLSLVCRNGSSRISSVVGGGGAAARSPQPPPLPPGSGGGRVKPCPHPTMAETRGGALWDSPGHMHRERERTLSL